MANRINFSVLGIEFETENFIYRDLGFTDNPHKLNNRIRKVIDPTYNESIGLYSQGYPERLGLCGNIKSNNFPIIVISYIHYNPKEIELFIRGHEETHALHFMNRLELLEEKLMRIGRKINLKKFPSYEKSNREEIEFVAHIGGLYSLERAGIDREIVQKTFPEPKCSAYPKAIEAYKNILLRN